MSQEPTPLLRRLTRSVPSNMRAPLRQGALAWGKSTARWRALPGLVVLGAQRCGTTTLFRLLSEHPEIVRPTLDKSVSYFDLGYHRGPRWYRAHFPVRRAGRIAFESTGYYMFHPLAAERIARDLPGVRVVAMVRDPVERAYSAHAHELRRGFEDQPFERALELEPQRLAGEVERIRTDPSYESHAHRHHAYLARGRYAELMQPYLDLLGRDRVLVLDPWLGPQGFHEEWRRLQEWLGVSAWEPEHIAAWNPAPRSPMDPALAARLREYFTEPDAALEPLLGRVASWRT